MLHPDGTEVSVTLSFMDFYRKKPISVAHYIDPAVPAASSTYVIELDVQSSAP